MIRSLDYGPLRYFQVARTFLGRALYWTGVYFIDGVLVDSGPPNQARAVEQLCRELNVRQCVTTHHHEDHCGAHHLLGERLGIPLLAHSSSLGLLTQPDARPQLYRRVAWGVAEPAQAEALGEWLETPEFRFQVIHTPGHAADHVVLFEAERRWLFSGDLYLAPKLRYLRSDEDIYAMLDSLRRVVALEPAVLFCQHRGRVENATAMLRTKLDFLVGLGERIHDLHRQGIEEREISRRVTGGDLRWRLWTSGHFSGRNFVRAFLHTPQPTA